MAELLASYEEEIGSLTLVPSDGGRFEVSVDGELVFSKLKLGRQGQPGEISGLVGGRLRRPS